MPSRGFSLIEMMIVIVVLGILAAVATLKVQDLRNNARIAGIMSDLENVRLSAYNYWADHDAFPPEAGAGAMPAGLDKYMTGGFRFDNLEYTLDWENFQGSGGGMQVGVLVTSSNAKLMSMLAHRASGGLPYFVAGSTVAFIIVGPDGAM